MFYLLDQLQVVEHNLNMEHENSTIQLVCTLILTLVVLTGDVFTGSERGESIHLGVLQEWFGSQWWTTRPYALLFIVLFILLPLVLFRRVGKAMIYDHL